MLASSKKARRKAQSLRHEKPDWKALPLAAMIAEQNVASTARLSLDVLI